MNKKRSAEILCTACGEVALVRIEPIYDGFKKIGEAFLCTHCGHRYENEAETPFVEKDDSRPALFTDADKPKKLSIFDEEERRHSCTWCRHFVINPFTQRCGLTNKTVDATDLCVRFEPKEEAAHGH